jgi:hypothetical protein
MNGRAAQGVADLAAFVRYARGLRAYMAARLDEDECRRRVAKRLERREDNLVRLLEERIFRVRQSPYRALFDHAGIELSDAVGLVREEGVEGALGRFHDAGVYVTLDELKGRRPIRRGSLTLDFEDADFDNPETRYVFSDSSSGSRGPARRTKYDFAHMEDNAVHSAITLRAYGILGRPYAVWRPVPPGEAGLRDAINHVKIGHRIDRWFTQYPLSLTPRLAREYLLTRYTIAVSRKVGLPIPEPEHVPLERAEVIARWLAQQRAMGTPAYFGGFPSSGVRVCMAAKSEGLDISGTLFRFGGEPLTEAKARIVEELGASAYCGYAMTETGRIGLTCGNRAERDEVHLATDSLGVIERERSVAGRSVGALHYTTLLPTSAKVLLNFESGDYGVSTERSCGCEIEALGLRRHLHTIRSYEKLTSEGMSFIGTELLRLVEEVLPARFGGGPADYQLVEEELGGLPKVSVVVSPDVGEVEEQAVVSAVLDMLGSGPVYKDMMASFWQAGQTLRVVRREPYATRSAKILPLHMLRQ